MAGHDLDSARLFDPEARFSTPSNGWCADDPGDEGVHRRRQVPSRPSIFISYAHKDGELARALGQALRRRKCRVWIDEGEMRVGDSLIERIATAIREVEFVVALVSEASVGSNWCRKELSLAITGGLGREGVKVLPVRVGNVEMPAALADTFWLALDPSSVSDAAARIKKDAEAHLTDGRLVGRPGQPAARTRAQDRPRPSVAERTSPGAGT